MSKTGSKIYEKWVIDAKLQNFNIDTITHVVENAKKKKDRRLIFLWLPRTKIKFQIISIYFTILNPLITSLKERFMILKNIMTFSKCSSPDNIYNLKNMINVGYCNSVKIIIEINFIHKKRLWWDISVLRTKHPRLPWR